MPTNLPPSLPRVSWAEHAAKLARRWRPGEDCTVVGPKGNGKTRLAVRGLLPVWNNAKVCILDIKGDDPELQVGIPVKAFPSRLEQRDRDSQGRRWWRVRLKLSDRMAARRVAYGVLARAHNQRHWAIYCDELVVISDPMTPDTMGLGLRATLDHHYLVDRYRPVTLIAASQQPSKVPTASLDQSTHLYLGPMNDDYRNVRGGELLGSRAFRTVLNDLHRYEWVYVYRPEHEMEIVSVGV